MFTFPMTFLASRTESLIDRTTGTNIGDYTALGGLAAAFDGTTNQAGASCAGKGTTTSGYCGKTLSPAGRFISRALIHGSNNNGYVNSANPSMTMDIYGKTGSAPASSTDGTIIGTITFTDTANESASREITCDSSTAYDHVWVRMAQGGASATMTLAELVLYEMV